jgi:glucose/arabinose dehydrogenase
MRILAPVLAPVLSLVLSLALTAPLASASAPAAPALDVRPVVRGLAVPWDVQPIDGGRLLITERTTRRLLLWNARGLRTVRFPRSSVWASGETGLMSLAVDPRFGSNRRIYTCQGGFTAKGHDVRVVAWRLRTSPPRVRRLKVLVRGIPARTGRHGGCRLLVARNGALLVGTGDAAVGWTPQRLRSWGGKTLRLNRFTGAPHRHNPWRGSPNRKRRYVFTYGHRNVQGLAQRSDGTLWSVEHGPARDDEVNRLVRGGNYGWDPRPGYDESVPMTDHSLPGTQIDARWSSGSPTIATSGAAWVEGAAWGSLDGTLAVAALKGSRMVFMRFDEVGRLQSTSTPSELQGYGRLRSVTSAPDGSLLVTTSNGSNDAVLRVTPLG